MRLPVQTLLNVEVTWKSMTIDQADVAKLAKRIKKNGVDALLTLVTVEATKESLFYNALCAQAAVKILGL